MTTTLTPGAASSAGDKPDSSADADKPIAPEASARTAASNKRAKKDDGSDIGGFFEKVRARTEAAKVKKLKADMSRRAKDLAAAADLGISPTDLAGDVVESAPFYKDVPRNMVIAAIEEIIEKERAKK